MRRTEAMRFRVGTTDAVTVEKDGVVVGCRWNGYRDVCARCNLECPVRSSQEDKGVDKI